MKIDSPAQQLYGIRAPPVTKSSGSRDVRVPGRVAADQTRIVRVNVGATGQTSTPLRSPRCKIAHRFGLKHFRTCCIGHRTGEAAFTGLRKKSKRRIPRGLQSVQDDKNKDLNGTTEVVP